MALRQYRPDQHPNEETLPYENQAPYQEYESKQEHTERLKDVLFFVNIVLFSICSVLSTYVYLSWNLPTFLAFGLGTVTGFIGLRLVQKGIRTQYKRIRMKKRMPSRKR